MKSDGPEIEVISRNFDLTVRRRWSAQLTRKEPPLLELTGIFQFDVKHKDLGLIRKGTLSHEFYWTDRWYNVFRFHEPSGDLRNFYCNINMPPVFSRNELVYVDLDIDVVVWPDGTLAVLDEDEFEVNSRKFGYPDELHANVDRALNGLLELITKKEFPFHNR